MALDVIDRHAESAAVRAVASGSQDHSEGDQPPDRPLVIPTDSDQLGRVT